MDLTGGEEGDSAGEGFCWELKVESPSISLELTLTYSIRWILFRNDHLQILGDGRVVRPQCIYLGGMCMLLS